MKELLDQKSIIQELRPHKPKEELRPRPDSRSKEEIKPKEVAKPAERPKTQYIIADNYVPRDQRKQQVIIEADEKPINTDEKNKNLKEQSKKPTIRKSEKIMEGVEISETLKRGK
jgi:hypothetical protein